MSGEPRDRPGEDAALDAEEARRRARRRAEVFGEVLPESTRDDRDPEQPVESRDRDAELKRNVPPHHG
ncbi:hypothetical protein [Nocardioides marmoribigeumensis]|uniref:Uncharacterized protein n=1 Tax=Nocardioides marmoribigeumensis TaxID=433649 RepID=A0ABU2BZD3_9ACTN|nr:hypothetical protein [Nocardioides marmoribigeumensis]MDR7363765.1 hypothetical protein [Nocardioides marmoribigeumensis]